MRNTMSTPPERSSGAILGLPGEVEGSAAFVYDGRGPRVSPAIEVQSWLDPKLVGEPVQDPSGVGVHALGFGVADVDAAVAALTERGCRMVGHGEWLAHKRWATVRDANGVTLDIVGDDAVPSGETRMRHLRITCTDLSVSVPWYEGVGFEVLGQERVTDATVVGLDGPVDAVAARLRLPDEPFEVLLIEWKDPKSHGRHYAEPNHAGIFRAAVGVDDTRAAYEAMSGAGWTFDRAPMLVELKGTPVPDMWICFISDPDGVPFEFVERPRSAFVKS